MACLIYTRPDDGVSIVRPTPEYLAQFPTELDGLAAVIAKDIPRDARGVRICEEADIPPNRRFRDCWRRMGMELPQVDMPLARTQRMNEVRRERGPKLAKSDVDLLKAQEAGNTTLQASLRVYRQALRDIPQTEQVNVEACTTPEHLETWAPAWPTDPA